MKTQTEKTIHRLPDYTDSLKKVGPNRFRKEIRVICVIVLYSQVFTQSLAGGPNWLEGNKDGNEVARGQDSNLHNPGPAVSKPHHHYATPPQLAAKNITKVRSNKTALVELNHRYLARFYIPRGKARFKQATNTKYQAPNTSPLHARHHRSDKHHQRRTKAQCKYYSRYRLGKRPQTS